MIRVALDARVYGARGIGRYTQAVHEGLLARTEQVAVTAFARTTAGRPGTWQRLGLPGYVAEEQLEMSRRFGRGGFDVVHLTANTAPAIRAGWPPTVVTVHDVLYLKGPRDLPISPSPRQTAGRAYRIAAFLTGTLWADHLMSDSQATADDLRKMFGRRLPPVTVVPCAVDPAFAEPVDPRSQREVLDRYGLREREYFLHPGAVDPRKNTRVVLRAFAAFRAAGGIADLAIIGIPERAREALRQEGVHVLPFLPNADVVALLKSAQALVYVPSAEGFGYPLVEAMAAGTPAIISSIDVLRESARGAALEAAPGDASALAAAMAEASGAGARIREVAERGRARAADFTIERMTTSIIAVYEQAIQAAAGRARRAS